MRKAGAQTHALRKGHDGVAALRRLHAAGVHQRAGEQHAIIAGDASAVTLDRWCAGIPAAESAAAYALVHDKVTSICPRSDTGSPNAYNAAGTATLRLTQGWSWGRPIV